MAGEETYVAEDGKVRMRGLTMSLPVVTGSVAIALAKKAVTESATHRWSVYLRTPDGTDISHVIKCVRFGLHSSFADPVREVSRPPYELSESGWGEFTVSVFLVFHDDSGEEPLELFHPLQLYEVANPSVPSKRPVVNELREEVVLWEPTEALYRRLASPRRLAPPSPLEQFFASPNAENEYRKIQAARQRVATVTAATLQQLEEVGGPDQD